MPNYVRPDFKHIRRGFKSGAVLGEAGFQTQLLRGQMTAFSGAVLGEALYQSELYSRGRMTVFSGMKESSWGFNQSCLMVS